MSVVTRVVDVGTALASWCDHMHRGMKGCGAIVAPCAIVLTCSMYGNI